MTNTINRSAPKGGYDNPKKAEWRSWAWQYMRGGQTKRVGCGAHALLMPSSEGLEIDAAVTAGFCENNLHCVDKNTAIIASLRRKGYKKFQPHGVSFTRAHERLWVNGVSLRAASIDLCQNVTPGLVRTLDHCSSFGVWDYGARVVINVLRGRETSVRAATFDHPRLRRSLWVRRIIGIQDDSFGRGITTMDIWRCWLICTAMQHHVVVPDTLHAYVSTNNQPFLSFGFRVFSVAGIKQRIVAGEASGWNVSTGLRSSRFDAVRAASGAIRQSYLTREVCGSLRIRDTRKALECDAMLESCSEAFDHLCRDGSWNKASLVRAALLRNAERAFETDCAFRRRLESEYGRHDSYDPSEAVRAARRTAARREIEEERSMQACSEMLRHMARAETDCPSAPHNTSGGDDRKPQRSSAFDRDATTIEECGVRVRVFRRRHSQVWWCDMVVDGYNTVESLRSKDLVAAESAARRMARNVIAARKYAMARQSTAVA